MNEEREPKTPSSLASKTWNAARPKVKKNHWNYLPVKLRSQLAELSPVIKPVAFGSKVYRLGSYTGTVDELKEFAAMKGLKSLRCGVVKYKVA
jgi:hypothetical protein